MQYKDFQMDRRQSAELLSNVWLGNLYSFIDIFKKIIRNSFIFFKLLLFSKFVFKDPAQKKIIIFDCEGAAHLEILLKDYNFLSLSVRTNKMKTIYISKKIILYMLKNFFKKSLKQNYLICFLKIVDPKVVVTMIDNSRDFYIIAKALKNNIKLIAVQGAHRGLEFITQNSRNKIKAFIPEFLCFSDYDKDLYQEHNIDVGKYVSIGAFRASLSLNYIKDKKIKIVPDKYDICLVSEVRPIKNDDDKIFTDKVGLLAEYTHRLCKKNNLKLIFAGEANENTLTGRGEITFYKKYLKNENFKIHQAPRLEFPSYLDILQSRLVIGTKSTLLRESFGLNKKTLVCSWTGNIIDKFPIEDDLFILTEQSYESFEKRVLKILSIDENEYFKNITKKSDYVMSPSRNTCDVLKQKINTLLSIN